MLGDSPIATVLLATDMKASREFWANAVGLQVVRETPTAITFKAGGDSELAISKSTIGTRDDQTQATFRVKDLRAELAQLRARGVKIEDYDLPYLKTVEGIADVGFGLMAWFLDPARNCVGILQLK